MASRETENNTYAKFSGDKQRALWYVMVFSGVVNYQRALYIHIYIPVHKYTLHNLYLSV